MKEYAIRNTDDTSRNVTCLHLPFLCHFSWWFNWHLKIML